MFTAGVVNRQILSACKPLLESSSIDVLRTIKHDLPNAKWQKFLREELPGLRKFKDLGVLEKENLAAQEFGCRFQAKTWVDYIKALIADPATGLNNKSTCRDFVEKAFPRIYA